MEVLWVTSSTDIYISSPEGSVVVKPGTLWQDRHSSSPIPGSSSALPKPASATDWGSSSMSTNIKHVVIIKTPLAFKIASLNVFV
jgi:hypothetical protein